MNNVTQAVQPLKHSWRDYLTLCKPRVVVLMLITAVVGMYLATSTIVPLPILFGGIFGIGLVAAAGAVVNHIFDRQIDGDMHRTKYRPLPTGRITTKNALIFALILACSGMTFLLTMVNVLTALLTFLAFVGYAGVYTLFLKRLTPQNIVIGGASGAAPPLLGWVAVSGHVDPQALLLMLIIFVWTPAHFWALAIHRHKEYAKVNIPMLPVTHGIEFTKLNVLLYTFLVVAASLMPFAVSMSGMMYLVGAIVLDLIFLGYALTLLLSESPYIAIKTFHYSNIYLMTLFVLLLVDHYYYLT